MVHKRILITVMICGLLLAGCSSETYKKNTGAFDEEAFHESAKADIEEIPETEAETNDYIETPYVIETADGDIVLNQIYIWERDTEHGHTGNLVFEFDLSDLDENQLYWFWKDYKIELLTHENDKSKDDTLPISGTWGDQTDESMIEKKIYIYRSIKESKDTLDKYNLRCYLYFISSSEDSFKIEIDQPVDTVEIVDDLPWEPKFYWDELISNAWQNK